jgi:hypothetical protein
VREAGPLTTGGAKIAASFSIGVRPCSAIEKRSWLYSHARRSYGCVRPYRSAPAGVGGCSGLAHQFLAAQRKCQRKLGPVVDLNLPNGERQRIAQLAEKGQARVLFCRRYNRSTRTRVPSSIAVYGNHFIRPRMTTLTSTCTESPDRSFSNSFSCFGRRRRVFTSADRQGTDDQTGNAG